MKRLLTIIILGFSVPIYSQDDVSFLTPPPSPEATFSQQWVNGEVTVTYSRPLVRGRKIFGGLVPFDSLWRTGASGATKIRFTEEIMIGDKILNPGTYALFTIPHETDWTVIINSDTTLHGAVGYDSKNDIHRFTVKSARTQSFSEAFTIHLNDITSRGSGFLSLNWENTLVRIPVKSPVDDKVMAQITARLVNSKDRTPELLFEAANYYYTTGRDLRQAATWAAEAEKADKENFYYPNLLQKVLGDLNDSKAAIGAARRALILAEKNNMTSAAGGLKKRITELERK